jgi:mannan endo-1,4-beta-mannosidase
VNAKKGRGGSRKLLVTLAAAVLLAAFAIGLNGEATSFAGRAGFVYRDGATLMLDGAPYRFVGVNNYDLTGCHTGSPASRDDSEKFFAQLPPHSATRVWAFATQGIDGINQTVALASKYHQKLILALADGAGHCGEPGYDAGWYKTGYLGPYLSWVNRVTTAFKDSPAVAIWEIMNEPGTRLPDGNAVDGLTEDVMKSFFDTTAARIKQNDPHHLVSTGSVAPWADFEAGVAGYTAVHSGPDIDLVSLHEYDYPYQNSGKIVSDWFAVAQEAARDLNKPIYVGEAGISLAAGCMSASQRADALRQKFDAYLSAGASGVNYWVVLGAPNNPGDVCNSNDGNRDPMIGGPIMELISTYRPSEACA